MESNRANSVDKKLNVNNRHFNTEQRRSIEELVTNLNLNRGMVERGDFIASLKADAKRIQSTRQFKADKREAKGGVAENIQDDFSNNSIAKFHMAAIEEITTDIKSSNRHQLKNNAARIEQLVGFLEKSDLQDKEFLKQKYLKTLEFVETEEKKKAAMTAIIGGKVSELATDYLDVRAIYSGFFANNPIAMGAFSLASKAIKQAKTNRAEKAAALEADAEATIVNTRNESINANDERRDNVHQNTLQRIRMDNQTGGVDDEILGAFNGGNVSPTSQTQLNQIERVDDTQPTEHLEGFDEFVAANSNANADDAEMTRLFVENSAKSVEILTRIQGNVEVIGEFFKNQKRAGRSEELQGSVVSRDNTPPTMDAEELQEPSSEDNHNKKRRRTKKSNRRNSSRNRTARARSGRAGAGVARGVAGGIGSAATKIGSRGLLKLIPGVGLAMGLGGAASRISGGDYGGAGAEALAGLASMIPGIGTTISLGITAGLAASDLGAFDGVGKKSELEGLMQSKSDVDESKSQAEQLKVLEDLLKEFKGANGKGFTEMSKGELESYANSSSKNAGQVAQIKNAQKKLEASRLTRKPNSKFNGNVDELYAKAISDPNYEFGGITRVSETSKLNGAGTISTGKGDHGGKSYGSNQLSKNSGTLQSYLKSSDYGKKFEGLEIGSAEFDSKWKDIAAKDRNFGKDQNSYIDKTHYTPFMEKAQASGIDVEGRSNGVKEILHSTANQYGANTNILNKFAKAQGGVDSVNQMSDSDLIKQFSEYKENSVSKYFKSSSNNIQNGVTSRIQNEKLAALGLDNIQSNGINSEMATALDNKTNTLNETKVANSNTSTPVVINNSGSQKQPNQKRSTTANMAGLVARNNDSTITRLSDRFISDSMT